MPKMKSEHIWYDGRRFRGYGGSLEQAAFRCERYLPSGTSPTTPNIIWTGREVAKKQNPTLIPYRCPGVLVVDKKTGRVSFSIACECTPTRVGVAPLANAAVSVGHRIYKSVNSAVMKNSGKNGKKSSSKNAGDGAKLRIPRKADS
jgi:hypothetical protein